MTLRKRGAEITVPDLQQRYEFDASVAALTGGRALVTWTEAGLRANSGEFNRDIHARVLARDGKAVGDELVIDRHPFEQTEARATGLADGGFAVVWRSETAPPGEARSYEVVARFYDAGGVPQGRAVQVDAGGGSAGEPEIATLADGSVVVLWGAGDADGSGIHLRHYSAAGVPIGGDMPANTATTGYQVDGAIAALPDGGFAVAWTDTPGKLSDAGGSSVLLQLFSADGARAGGPVTVADAIPSPARPSLTALTDGTLAVGYSEYDVYTGVMNAFVRHVGRDGVPLGPAQGVYPETAGHQLATDVVALGNGGYLLAWTDLLGALGDGNGATVLGQAFASDGTHAGAAFRINTTQGDGQFAASLARLSGGGIVAAWSGETRLGHSGYSDGDVHAQLFAERPGPAGTIDAGRAFAPDQPMWAHAIHDASGGPASPVALHGMVDFAAIA